MKYILHQIKYFKIHHPYLFWWYVIALLIILTLIIVLIKLKKRNNINSSNKNIKIIDTINDKTKIHNNWLVNTLKSKLLYTIFGIVLGIIIGVISFNNCYFKSENINISHSKYVFGIDISHYQGKIDWIEMRTSHHPIEFVFIRASMGKNEKDKQFDRNWKMAKKYNYIRGAYHYYRPNENSTLQFTNFAKNVVLKSGDFPPILDIEKQSKYGTESLRKGILNWLKLAEKKYGIKPVIYTGRTFYVNYLKGYINDYPLWIASYSDKYKLKEINWDFHQFTENVRVKGIRATVDGNDFKGELFQLKRMCKK